MTIKIFSTDTQCPVCGTDIYNYVYQRISEGAGTYFELDCPACGKTVTVEVESVPALKMTIEGGAR